MTVLQLIAVGGGLLEFADAKNIVVVRKDEGRDVFFKFNYKDVSRQKKLDQNIVLKPGDTVIVP
jgi:polysaccharide export outer membrane protein